MKEEFSTFIQKNKLFDKKSRLLLAISGGVDSVVLAYLLKAGSYNFALAHCNFKLRAKDSQADEEFCRKLAEQLHVVIHVISFDTLTYAKKHGSGIQEAARDLRYGWFKQLVKEHGYGHLLTAHHANDNAETVLINLLRGTGIKGLAGISEKRDYIVRPLLPFTKEEINAYAKKNKIRFRIDKSNLEDKYERNFLRHNIVPVLKKLNPGLEATFSGNSARFKQEAGLLQEILSEKKDRLLSASKNGFELSLQKLDAEKYRETILHFILGPLRFNESQISSILQSIQSGRSTGKLFHSPGYSATIDREKLIIKQKTKVGDGELSIHSLEELRNSSVLKFSELKKFSLPKNNELLLNREQLVFPMVLRGIARGDKFRPFGMKGFKLLSDFMREQKLNAFEKEQCRLLINGNGDVLWVVGLRSDDRYKVNETGTSLIKLTC